MKQNGLCSLMKDTDEGWDLSDLPYSVWCLKRNDGQVVRALTSQKTWSYIWGKFVSAKIVILHWLSETLEVKMFF